MTDNYRVLISKLDAFIRKYYKNRLIKGAIYALALVLSLFLSVAMLEYFVQFKQTGRTILFYSFILSSSYVLVYYLVIPLLKLYQFGKIINHNQAADIIGKHFSQVNDKLTNVLQLHEMSGNTENQLLLAGIDQKAFELKPVPFTEAINLGENKKQLKFILIPALFILGVITFSPNIIRDSTERLIKHNSAVMIAAPFSYVFETPLEVLRNEDYKLVVSVEGNAIPEKVFLVKNGVRTPLMKEKNTQFSFLFKNVNESEEFSLYASGFDSQNYQLKVLPKPTLTNIDVSLTYPKYLEKENQQLNNTGDLVVPEGTKIKWAVSSEDASAMLFVLGDSVLTSNKNSTSISCEITAENSLSYFLIAENDLVDFADSVKYTLSVVKDEFPQISVVEKRDSTNDKKLYFNGEIKDDYGFSRLTFNYQILTKVDSLPNRNELNKVDLSINKRLTEDEFFHFWNMEGENLLPGDEISYYFELWDNDGYSGAKSVKSVLKTAKTKTSKEVKGEINKSEQDIKDDLAKSLEETKEFKEKVDKLRKKLSEKKELGWQEKKELEELIETQKQLEKQFEELSDENAKKNEQLNEISEQNEDILKKQEQLQELFEELMSDEMKQLMERLEEMMEKMNKNMLENNLEEMELSSEDLEKELDRSLELFKQLEVDQKMEDLKNRLNETAKKQEELAEKTENKEGSNEELKKEQEELEKEFDEIKKELDDLKSKDQELERPKGIDEMKDKQEEVSNEMSESSEKLENNKNKKASESQKSAAEKMQEMANQLEQMQADASQEGEDMDALRQLLENLLYLSFEQEALMADLKGVKRQSPEYVKITQRQHKLKDDAKMIEDSLFALSKRVVQLESTVNKEIRQINSNMDKAIGFMEERQTPLAMNRQQYVMTSANNLALLFDEALQQMQQQAQQKQGEGSCDNPGGAGKPKPGSGKGSVGNMRQLQEQLSKQLEDLKKSMEEGSKPGQNGKPKTGLPNVKGGMSKSLAKTAAQQAKIRQQLQEMRNGQNAIGKKAIDQMTKLMEETETDLVNKRITQQTLNRQKEILTRLLESERAEREQDKDDKRESVSGREKEVSNPELYFEYNRKKDKQVDLLKTTPPNLNKYFKNKVSKYFQTIN